MKKYFRLLSIFLTIAILLCSLPLPLSANAASINDLTYKISNGEAIVTGCNTTASGSIVVPNSINGYPVTTIGRTAFSQCRELTSIVLPDTVTVIEDQAFNYCISVTAITMRDGVTNIGSYAFNHCEKLRSISIPNTVTAIGEYAFNSCVSMTTISLSENLKNIEVGTFNDCVRLTEILLPDHLDSIEDSAFRNCKALTSVTIPNSISILDSGVFSGCESITSIHIPNGISAIHSFAFNNCTSLVKIDIPDNVQSIGYGAFGGCKGLTSIVIPDSVTAVGEKAFSDCTNLTDVTIGAGITQISQSMFSGCTKLQDITIPYSVEEIADYAFSSSGLKTITLSKNIAWIGDYSLPTVETIRYLGTEADFSGVEMAYSAVFDPTILYLTPYYICYDANGGSNAPATQYDGDGAKISSTIPVRAGYYFLGWSTLENGDLEYMPGDRISVQSDCTLYAVWLEEYMCNITYNTKGGVGCPSYQEVKPFFAFTITDQVPVMEGYTFLGWSATNGGEVQYAPSSSCSTMSDLVLYAVWQHACSVCSGVGHSSKLCEVCSGEGGSGTECETCGADGTITVFCGQCYAGSVMFDCAACNATGEVLVEEYIDCRQCSGKGCRICGYSGIEYSLGYQTCSKCSGKGYTFSKCPLCTSGVISESTCENCGGDGWAVWNDCEACAGTKWEYYQRTCASCSGDGVIILQDGNLNFDGTVNEDDAIYLLQHVLLPDIFTVSQNVDYNKDGTIDEDDAIYLLQHVLLPDLFPIS